MLRKREDHIVVFIVCVVFAILFTACSDSDTSEDSTADLLEITVATFGGSLNDNANAVVNTVDGGYIILGHTQSNDGDIANKPNTSFDFWVLKFNAQNEIEWTNTYGGSDDDRGQDVIQTGDGSYVIVGYSTSSDGDLKGNAGAQDHWVVKLDPGGNLVWQKSFGFSGRDEGISVIETSDNGLVVVGILDVTASNGEGSSLQRRHAGGDYWVLKLDANGELLWRNFFGGTFTDTAYDVVETSDQGYLVIGSSDSEDVDIKNNRGTYDFWAVRLDSEGNMIWENSYGGSEIDEAYATIRSNDGNYLILGDTRSSDKEVSFNHGGADVWLIKINDAGELLWDKSFGGTAFDAGRAIVRSDQGGYLITGSSRSLDGDLNNNQGQNDAWIIKITEEGTMEWQQALGGSEIDFGRGIAELEDGTIIMVGETGSNDGDIPANKGFTDVLKIELK
ncbi:MAG: hypothetical protein AAF634_10730 [Bacteroidota bacterium]